MTNAATIDLPLQGNVDRDVTPQVLRNGDVLIDVTYEVRGTDADGPFVAYRATRAEAVALGGTYERTTITQTADEYAESEFCRLHDC